MQNNNDETKPSPSPIYDSAEVKVAAVYGFDNDYVLAIGKNSNYYCDKFHNIDKRKSEFSWNWAALLCGPMWLVYRKMYVLGITTIIISNIPAYINKASYKFVTLLLSLFWASFGNAIYKRRLDRTIKYSKTGQEGWKTGYLKTFSGVSILAVIIIYALSFLAFYILSTQGINPVFAEIPNWLDWG